MAVASPFLSITELSFAYPGAAPLLVDAALSMEADERLLLSGPNASGKSTFLRLLMGIVTPTTATYAVAGRRVGGRGDYPWLRRQLGYCSQQAEDHLFCPTVGDDCRFGPLNYGLGIACAQQRSEHYLALLGLSEAIDVPPSHLSGGQVQLAALAAVMACEPQLLLLDEPSSALDEAGRERLCSALSAWHASGRGYLVVSHDAQLVAALPSRHMHLSAGQLHPGPAV